MPARHCLAVALATLTLTAMPARSQEVTAPGAAPAVTQSTVEAQATTAPTAIGMTVGVQRLITAPPVAQDTVRVSRARPVALMLVGAGGLIVGAIVEDEAGTIISVAGAVILLYGLYRFLQLD